MLLPSLLPPPLRVPAALLAALVLSAAGETRAAETGPRKVEDLTIYADARFHCAFPSLVRRPAGELLVAFRRAPDRRLLGEKGVRHVDPNSYLVLVRSRDDGRTWTKEPQLIYAHPFGGCKVAAELWVASTAKDTDFIVRVSDVYPDSRSMLIVDSIRRARYREGFEQEKLLTPGAVHRIACDLGWLSLVFNRGHRIRVPVASTGGPFYESNPNTGAPLTMEFPADAVVAHNPLYHHSGDASRIIAPVRPRANPNHEPCA